MSSSLERKDDGSLALFINNDLQFDSADERIYHESLTLPALAIVSKRIQSDLKVLVIGGGDGLVARELLKSDRVGTIDLVDCDPEIIKLAQSEFLPINESSLLNSRVKIHVQDAWGFVDEALHQDKGLHQKDCFDLIICDLTVPDDIVSARFHTVDWYAKLSKLAGTQGVVALNGVSAQATPEAFWCIFNGMARAGLCPRPCHVSIPSFSAQGYGDDWCFFLGSTTPIRPDELDDNLALPQPRQFLRDIEHLSQLFDFPEKLFDYQATSLPARAGSDILLHYFYNNSALQAVNGIMRSVLTLNTDAIVVPEPDNGKDILPKEISRALAQSINTINDATNIESQDAEMFLHGVLDLMPSLKREHTQEVIEDFLENPDSFLQAIDLPALVSRLLKRAVELPAQLVEELELLRDKLQDWAGDNLSLLNLGRRVLTILMLVIVLGNLLYPDMVYGKGEAAAGAAHSAGRAHSRGASGFRRGGGWYGGGGYWNGTRWLERGNPNTKKIIEVVPRVPSGSIKNYPAGKIKGLTTPANTIGFAESIDQFGTTYPARAYRLNFASINEDGVPANPNIDIPAATTHEDKELYAKYRLGPGADILPTGHIVMPLTEQSYLLVTASATHLIDQQSGTSIMPLHNDTKLLSLIHTEIDTQLEEIPTNGMATFCLNGARTIISRSRDQIQSYEAPSSPPGTEIFPSVFIVGNGEFLAAEQAGGGITYLDRNNWYSDLGNTSLNSPYPLKFKEVAMSYLSKIVKEAESTRGMLLRDQNELSVYLDTLTNELSNYEASVHDTVTFGSHQVPKIEAVRLTRLAITKCQEKIASLVRHLADLPAHIDLAKMVLANFAVSNDQRDA